MRSPLDVLKEDWTGDKENAIPVYSHPHHSNEGTVGRDDRARS